MRAADLDERNNPSSVLYYTPRRPRADDGSSIRPILERLSRGEAGLPPLVEPVPLVPSAEPVAAPAHRKALAIVARCAAVTAACIGVAAVAMSLREPEREDRAPLAASALPKSVQTVSFKSQARFGEDASPLAVAEATAEPLRAAAQGVRDAAPAERATALPAALASWAILAPARLPADWSPAAQTSFAAAEPAPRAHGPERATHRRAHLRRLRRAWHTAAVEARDGKVGAAAASVDNSLRSVLHKIFRPD